MAASATDKARKSYSLLTKSLSAGIDSVTTTIPFNNVTNIPTDTAVDFIIDRVDTNGNRTPTLRELCKGVVSGSNLINCTRGLHGTTAQSHLSGAVVEFVVSAVAQNDLVDFLLQDHANPSGYHKDLTDTNGNTWLKQTATTSAVNYLKNANAATGNGPTLTADGSDTNITLNVGAKGTGKVKLSSSLDLNNNSIVNFNGWSPMTQTVSSVSANGNRSYDITFNSTVANELTPGMRLRTTRTVTAPTQCTSLNGTNQYYSKSSPSGMTFTDDFVVSAWVKLSSYPTASSYIASRYNGTSGWGLQVHTDGTLKLIGYNAGASNFSLVASYQSLPLNKWIHVSAQLDMSAYDTATKTNSNVMFDGVDVPAYVQRGGTNPTALVQAGNLEIGTANATGFFPGKIAQVAIYSAKVTQATIKASMNQTLSGSETSLISAYSFNNSINDLNANANNLTANGGAVATDADSPFGINGSGTTGTYDYAIVTKVATTTATVQVPEGCTIPTSGGISAVDLSPQKNPYNFPGQSNRWHLVSLYNVNGTTTSNANYGAYQSGSRTLLVPIGDWDRIGQRSGSYYNDNTAHVYFALTGTSPAGLNAQQGGKVTTNIVRLVSSGTAYTFAADKYNSASLSAATAYTLYSMGATTSGGIDGDVGPFEIYAELAYL